MGHRRSFIVNATAAFDSEPSGVTRYLVRLLRAVEKTHPHFFDRYFYQKGPHRTFPGSDTDLVIHKGPSLKRFFRPLLREFHQLTGYRITRLYDTYWEPNHVFIPQIRSRRRILTVHDLSTITHPDWHPEKRLRLFNETFLPGVRSADHLIAVSNSVAEELTRLLEIPPDRISVVPNGVDSSHFRPQTAASLDAYRRKMALPASFVLFLGSLEPRKNLGVLLEAHRSLPESFRRRHPLVIAGPQGWENSHLRSLMDDPEDPVTHLGFIPENELPLLLGSAGCLVFPSLYEGFGLPPLEAMSCACPVIASDIAAHREVLGDAARLCPADEKDAFARAMLSLLESPEEREASVQKARARAVSFTWEASAEKLVKVLLNRGQGSD